MQNTSTNGYVKADKRSCQGSDDGDNTQEMSVKYRKWREYFLNLLNSRHRKACSFSTQGWRPCGAAGYGSKFERLLLLLDLVGQPGSHSVLPQLVVPIAWEIDRAEGDFTTHG